MEEFELKDYHEPLFERHGNERGCGRVTHEVLISKSAYTLAKMWLDGVKWNENLWGEVLEYTDKAIEVGVCNVVWWIPKRLIKKARKIR